MNKIHNNWLNQVSYEDLVKMRAVAGYVVIDASREKRKGFLKVGAMFMAAVIFSLIGGFKFAMIGMAIIALAGKMAYDTLTGVFESSDIVMNEQEFNAYLQVRSAMQKRQARGGETG